RGNKSAALLILEDEQPRPQRGDQIRAMRTNAEPSVEVLGPDRRHVTVEESTAGGADLKEELPFPARVSSTVRHRDALLWQRGPLACPSYTERFRTTHRCLPAESPRSRSRCH